MEKEEICMKMQKTNINSNNKENKGIRVSISNNTKVNNSITTNLLLAIKKTLALFQGPQ